MNAKTKSPFSIWLKIIKYLFMTFYLVVVLFPFYWILITSLKSSQVEIYAYPIRYWPETPSLINYINVIQKDNFGRYFLNSAFVSILAGVFAVTIGTFCSYVLARFKFMARGPLLFFFLFTQMIPSFLTLAPLYQMMSSWGMTNNRMSLVILYTNMMIPFSVVTLRGFFQGVPRSIEEAAQIDGCNRLQALFIVILPIILPGLASTLIFAFVNSWNELFMAIMFIDDNALKTLPVALNGLILKYDIEWGQLAAGTVISIIPTMVLFGFSQKYMASGLTAGAVKG